MPLTACARTKSFAYFSRLFSAEIRRTNFHHDSIETGSLIELLNFPRTQSIMSKLGFALERALKNFLQRTDGVRILNTRHDVEIYGHQLDLFFQYKKKIYYFEVKSNINLDTEKSKSVVKKLKKVRKKIKQKFPNKEAICFVLSARYDRKTSVKNIKKPLQANKHIYGYADFFELFKVQTNKSKWTNMFKKIGSIIENKSKI